MKSFLATIKGTYISKEIKADSKAEARLQARKIFDNIKVPIVIVIKEVL